MEKRLIVTQEEMKVILDLPLKWLREYPELTSKGDIMRELKLAEKFPRGVDSATPKDLWKYMGQHLFCFAYSEIAPFGMLMPLTKDAMLQLLSICEVV